MKKTLAVVALLAFAAVAAAQTGSWTGVITDSNCGEKDANAEGAKCSTKCVKNGAHWALWDPKAKQLYELVNAKGAEAMAGKAVTVKGTLADKKIDVSSLEAAAAAK